MDYRFGSFDQVCRQVSLPLCSSLQLAEPKCYSRNIDLNGYLVFQPATLLVEIVALLLVLATINRIRSKYTAPGRKEITMFFYSFALLIALESLLISNIVPAGSWIYLQVSAMHLGVSAVTSWTLLVNGILCFRLVADGSNLSLWSLRGTSLAVFITVYAISIGTFQNLFGMHRSQTFLLHMVSLVFTGVSFLIYVVLQTVFVLTAREDRWALGNIVFAAIFFLMAHAFIYAASRPICSFSDRYIDGLFFYALFRHILEPMMIFKAWDSTTPEDMEFVIHDDIHMGKQL